MATNTEANYTVIAMGLTDTLTCSSSGTSCYISVSCGSTYDVSTYATTTAGQSLPSYSIPLETGPCCPETLSVEQVTQSMTNITWSAATGARSYVTSLTSPRGHARCHTMDTHCLLGCITCGTSYNVSLEAFSITGHKSECSYHGFSASACCPSSVRLYRMDNNTLRVYWRSSPGLYNYTADLHGTRSNYTCSATNGAHGCDISEILCGEVYTVVVAPLTQEGSKVTYCPRRLYSVSCSGNTVGMVIYRGRRIPATSQITYSKAISSTSIRFDWSSAQGADKYILVVNGTFHPETHNLTFTSLSGQIDNLQRATSYSCYVYSANSAGLGTKSLVRTIRTLVQPPDNVAVNELTQTTARVTWNAISGVLLYQLSVMANNKPGFPPLIKNVTASPVNISNLEPCTTYTIGVASINMFLEPGESNNVTYTTSTIATVSSISVEYSCRTSTATVSWDVAFGATSYRAVITDGQGRSLNCTSMDTTCQISNLVCGERYAVRIIAIANCESTSDGSYIFETAPCPPKAPKVYRECSTNVILFSWEPTNNTAYYFAIAVDSDELVMECVTGETSCYFTDTVCGQTYSFYVSAIYSGGLDCKSGNTEGVVIKTAPCLPQNIYTTANCNSISSAIITWDEAAGAEAYAVEARGNRKDLYNCTSANTSCTLTDLDCGESLSVWIVATNGECTTDPVLGDVAETVPCIPQNVSAVETCSSDSASLTWNYANGAIFYIGMATHVNGTVHTCVAMVAECTIPDLRCGEAYDVYVMSTNLKCNSSESQHVTLQTAPCDPQNITTVLQCDTNTANVTWAASAGANGYTAMATDGQQQRLASCHSMGTSCQLTSLPCGMRLNVTVQADGATCNSSSQPKAVVETAPCTPTNVAAALNCTSNIASITWHSALGATWYLVKAEGNQGYKTSCNNTVTHCDIPNLQCGQEYSITVMGMNGDCMGLASQPVTLVSAPCPNTGIQASLDCSTNSALISWTPGNGSLSFNATLQSFQDPQKHNCFTNGSSCSISSLPCGQHYNISVTGHGQTCSTSSKTLVTLDTAPCVPTQVNVSLSCGSDTASVSWAASSGLVSYYIVTAVDDNGHTLSCNSSSTSCDISGLACGQAYNVTVTAMSVDCTGQRSDMRRINTAPCAPQSVVSQLLDCQTGDVQISWQSSKGAQIYYAQAKSTDKTLVCNSTSTSCIIPALGCGQTYNITVVAEANGCSSNTSAISQSWGNFHFGVNYPFKSEMLNTGDMQNNSLSICISVSSLAPCPPTSVAAVLDCSTNTVLVSWSSMAISGVHYTASAIGPLGPSSGVECNTTNLNCTLAHLQCGSQYNVTVTATQNNCTSKSSTEYSFITAPCPPTSVAAVLDCSTNTVLVSWSSMAISGVHYTASAIGPLGPSSGVECNTTNLNCTLAHLQCGSQYNVTVTATQNNCTSKSSTEYSFITAPCVPVLNDVALNCSSRSAVVKWSSSGLSLGAFSVSAVSTQGEQLGCGVFNNGECVVDGLQCGQTYTFIVNATQGQCTSAASNTLQRETAPCPPLNIQSIMNCGSNTASVSWSGGNGALSFTMTMECSNGQTHICSTNETGCDITNMACGQTCTVKVVAEGRSCNSSAGTGSPVITSPCVPQNVSASVSCSSNIATVTWGSSQGAELYTVTASSANVLSANCTSPSTSCDLSTLTCGESYTITVKAKGSNCSSGNSAPVQVQAAPCPPLNIQSIMNCGSNTASVSWSGGNGALSFTMTMECSNGQTHICSTNETGCDITNMACGQTCTVKVVAEGRSCNSSAGTGSPVITSPCVPQNVSASVSCSSNIATVTWGSSQGAELYTVTASSANVLSANCTSPSTSCDLSTLTCGESYTITVKAKGSNCSSGNSAPVQVQAVPCTPSNVLPTEDCVTKALVVSWTPSAGGQYYMATLQDSNGLSTTCQSTGSQCNVTGLSCGQLYHVNVTASDSLCSSPPSATVNTNSVPCAASSIMAVLDCQLGTATVSWQYSAGAQGYAVSALAPVDNRASCTSNSSITHCELSDLQCGNEYTVNVQSLGYTCNASAQMTGSLITGPCVPQNVSASVSCSSNIATVTWGSSQGAELYTVTASSANVLSANCTSPSTSCDLSTLTCGESYTITVKAKGSNCSSGNSAPVQVQAVPCTPSNVLPTEDCVTKALVVSWTPSAGGQYYMATLQDSNGLSTTCQSTGSQCNVTGLSCGQLYHVNVTASDSLCSSPPSATVNTNSVPCAASSIMAVLDCQLGTATVSWQYSAGAQGYAVSALAPVDNRASCTSNSSITHCELSDLQCGNEYTVNVQSLGYTCNASAQMTGSLITAPCLSTSVSAMVDCPTDSVLVSWSAIAGAENNSVTALGSKGQTVFCSTSQNHCNISSLQCGQQFNLTFSSMNQQCQTTSTTNVTFLSRPCVPLQPVVDKLCGNKMYVMSWDVREEVDYYVARAVSAAGEYQLCNSTSSVCSFPTLGCGETFTFTVTAHRGHCQSDASAPVYLSTDPCKPENVTAHVSCDSETVALDWSEAKGASFYIVMAAGSLGYFVNFNTTSTNLSVSLLCGQSYNVSVQAHGDTCDSLPSIPAVFRLALTPILDCGTGVGSLSWASSAGAETYEVEAVSEDGNTLPFSTNITSGFLSELLCGQQYQVKVRAINRQCRSVLSSPAYLSSVPCVPQNVVSELDCIFNFINIRWNISRGAASYLVVAKGPEGPVTACNTTAQECRLQTLHCSSSYNVSVIAVNQQCNTSGSSILRINTVPCVPTHVQGSVNCTTGAVSVSWGPSVGAISYAAVAQTSGGYASVCNSTGTACVFSDLLCGMNYSLAVSATDGTCNTAPSQPVVLSTVPCKLQNVSAQLNCDTNSAVVSWELSDNVTRHTVQAIGSDGHRIDCTSSDHSCTLAGMRCGQSYNITVTALDGACDNSNTNLMLTSAPCAPSNVQTSLHCNISGGVVSVSWVQANGAEFYMAVAVSNDGHSYSCNTTTASCDLQELQCGQIYNVSVYSLAHGCGGVKSTMSQVQTAPCPPQNVSAIVQCDSESVLVSWNPAVDASLFIVELESESTGAISSCNSTNTQCSITHLPCGERFNLSVVALRGGCQSQPSSDLSIASAPCIPQGVNGTVDCVTNSAWVSWDVVNAAESYTVLAVGEDGHNSTCSSSNSTCNVPDLGCGRSFTFHVTASNAACVSPPSSSFQLETAPCALSSIVVVAECHSSVIMVQWQKARSGNSLYFATAEDQDLSILSCNSSASSCNLTNVHCDKEYTIIVAASANKCSSLRSPPYKIRTAPCQPSSVQADTDCQSKDVFVSWNPSYVAQSYLLSAVGRNGDLKTCNTSNNNCTLTDLHCSNIYHVSVLASNENCTSLPSANITIKTVPCEPANLTATVQCGNSSSASLSWVGSTGTVAYMGLAQSETGTTAYCETTHTSCTLEGLVCGTVYNFTVQATDGFCNSSLSEPQTKGAAPCPPAGLRVVPRTVVNDTQILRASWSTVNCPNSEYLLALTGSIQGNNQALFDLTSYWTRRTFFEVPLLCGSTYSATISARNSAATSDKSAAVTGSTVPCAPLNVTFSASSAVVAWNESLFATNYTVYEVTSSGRTKLCMSSQLLCSVTNFSSGHIVVTAHNTAGESEDSVPVVVTAGRRRR
ncbi:uncharacterized protein [Sinocyclocheilus grahami]|uniref:uncharacterized protein n=1 Tax=Sinocyclocheilus grahami TaxID=75366 RepID=UPI0007ACDC18|nr:PREDICTED: fibronectin type III domain-containing protein 7 [Sinocyclocheilus grahami]